jgi:hypothetical protein
LLLLIGKLKDRIIESSIENSMAKQAAPGPGKKTAWSIGKSASTEFGIRFMIFPRTRYSDVIQANADRVVELN